MTANEFLVRIDSVIKQLDTVVPQIVESVVKLDAIALVKQRVIQKGLDKEGKPFSPYGKKSVIKKQAEGKSMMKNFFDTGQMWRSFGIQKIEKTPVTTVVVNFDETAREKYTNLSIAEKHSAIEGGNIADLSEKEIEIIKKNAQSQMTKYLKKWLEN